ncbi:MAG: Minf_1886 family protein [Pirellulales bacterium]
MIDPAHPISKLLAKDRRYKFDAYVFVFEALSYAQKVLGLGAEHSSEEAESQGAAATDKRAERHLSGQQLCEAIRQFALEQYGYMAKCVLNSWGVHRTADFGNIVFNLIDIKQMKKTKQDRREDFDDVFDFDEGLMQDFKITLPQKGNV